MYISEKVILSSFLEFLKFLCSKYNRILNYLPFAHLDAFTNHFSVLRNFMDNEKLICLLSSEHCLFTSPKLKEAIFESLAQIYKIFAQSVFLLNLSDETFLTSYKKIMS